MYYTDGYLFLISSIIYIVIFLIFASKKTIFREKKSFLFLCIVSAIYCFGNYGFLRIKLEEDFWYWQKIIRISSLLLPATIMMYVSSATKEKGIINRFIIILGYLISAVFILQEDTGMYIRGFVKGKNLIIPKAGEYFSYIIGYYLLYCGYSMHLLIRHFNSLKYTNERKYLRTIILAFFIFGIACVLNVLGLYSKRIGFLPEVMIFGATIIVLISITRHNIIQMSLIIRKNFVYAILTTFITAVFLVTILLCERLFEYIIGFRSFFPAAISALIIALIFQPLINKLQLFIDRSFFKGSQDKHKIIQNLSKNITTIIDKKSLISSVINIIIAIIHVERVSIYLLDKERKKYRIYDSLGAQKRREMEFDSIGILLSFLDNEKREILLCNLKEEIDKNKNYINLEKDMHKVKADICIPIIYKNLLLGFLSLGKKLSGDSYNGEDIDILWMLCNETAISLENIRSHSDTREKFLSTVKSLVEIIEARNPYVRNHGKSVAYYSAQVAQELGLSPETVKAISDGGSLHDIGMIAIDDEIVNKKRRLTEEEFESIKEHPNIGRSLLDSNLFPKEVYDAVQAHHESISGDGYPNELKGNAVLMAARIVAVANAYNAMRSERSYRRALDKEEAINELLMSSGKRFDKKVVDAFIRILNGNE
ncbi:MAG: HD domain-containing protein [bacterium]|nr:HD domain-containing protein [bacterium]